MEEARHKIGHNLMQYPSTHSTNPLILLVELTWIEHATS